MREIDSVQTHRQVVLAQPIHCLEATSSIRTRYCTTDRDAGRTTPHACMHAGKRDPEWLAGRHARVDSLSLSQKGLLPPVQAPVARKRCDLRQRRGVMTWQADQLHILSLSLETSRARESMIDSLVPQLLQTKWIPKQPSQAYCNPPRRREAVDEPISQQQTILLSIEGAKTVAKNE